MPAKSPGGFKAARPKEKPAKMFDRPMRGKPATPAMGIPHRAAGKPATPMPMKPRPNPAPGSKPGAPKPMHTMPYPRPMPGGPKPSKGAPPKQGGPRRVFPLGPGSSDPGAGRISLGPVIKMAR